MAQVKIIRKSQQYFARIGHSISKYTCEVSLKFSQQFAGKNSGGKCFRVGTSARRQKERTVGEILTDIDIL